MIFSIIGIQISQQLGLNDTQFGLLIATPVLTGSVSRVFLGIWSDQFGGRKVMVLVMLCGAVATWMLTYAQTYSQFLVAALCVGIAGGNFGGRGLRLEVVPGQQAGHCAGHLRCRQHRFGGDRCWRRW